jgi:hypothetical protein
MRAVGAGCQREIEAVVDEEQRSSARRECADLRRPREQLAIGSVLGPQLHYRRARRAGCTRLCDG